MAVHGVLVRVQRAGGARLRGVPRAPRAPRTRPPRRAPRQASGGWGGEGDHASLHYLYLILTSCEHPNISTFYNISTQSDHQFLERLEALNVYLNVDYSGANNKLCNVLRFSTRQSSEASGSKTPELNRNEPPAPRKLTVPIASLDHDLNSDELLFAVGEWNVYLSHLHLRQVTRLGNIVVSVSIMLVFHIVLKRESNSIQYMIA